MAEKKTYYFLLNFKQMEDFRNEYASYSGAWHTTVLPYTIIHGIPDAVQWNTNKYIAKEVIERYGLSLIKETEDEEYWKY